MKNITLAIAGLMLAFLIKGNSKRPDTLSNINQKGSGTYTTQVQVEQRSSDGWVILSDGDVSTKAYGTIPKARSGIATLKKEGRATRVIDFQPFQTGTPATLTNIVIRNGQVYGKTTAGEVIVEGGKIYGY